MSARGQLGIPVPLSALSGAGFGAIREHFETLKQNKQFEKQFRRELSKQGHDPEPYLALYPRLDQMLAHLLPEDRAPLDRIQIEENRRNPYLFENNL